MSDNISTGISSSASPEETHFVKSGKKAGQQGFLPDNRPKGIELRRNSGLPRKNDKENNVERGDLEKATTDSETGSTSTQRVVTAADWQGPDDPANPRSWPKWKKNYHVYTVAFLAFSVTCGSSIITPASTDIQHHFNVSGTAAILPLTVFVLGLALGPAFAAPLSENFGRTIIYQCSSLLYLLFLIGAGFSNSFGGMLACRLFAGISGAPVLAVGTGTTADISLPIDYAAGVSIFITAPFLGPALGPVIGGFAAYYKGWRWTIWCTIFIGIVGFLLSLQMQETHKKAILKKREKLNSSQTTRPLTPSIPGWNYWKLLFTTTLARPLRMLALEPTVLAFSSYTAFTFAILFAFFAAYPYIFESVYGFNTWESGLAFLGVGLGNVFGAIACLLCDRLIYQKKFHEALQSGRQHPFAEERLHAAMIGAFGLPIGLFWLGWTARQDIHWISPVLSGIPFAFGNITLFISTVLYLVDVYGPQLGASAMAANGIMRYTLGACFPLFTVQMYERLGIGWATSLLGFVCVLLLPIPFIFFRFGPSIRAKSRILMTE